MTPRERFLGVADGTLTNHLYLALNLNVGWFMEETLERWHGEGLQEGADLAERFGLDRVCFTGWLSPKLLVVMRFSSTPSNLMTS